MLTTSARLNWVRKIKVMCVNNQIIMQNKQIIKPWRRKVFTKFIYHAKYEW